MTVKLAVLLSGGGTTLQNFIDRIADGRLDAEIPIVVSSTPRAGGIERARKAGIDVEVVDRREFEDDVALSAAITDVIERYDVDLVILGGFLRRYVFPERWKGRVLNVHPGPLPQFGGKGMYGHHVHEAVLAAGERESAASVIIADEEYDHGPVLVEKRVPVLADDTPETLAARVFAAECDAFPEAVELMAGRLGLTASTP